MYGISNIIIWVLGSHRVKNCSDGAVGLLYNFKWVLGLLDSSRCVGGSVNGAKGYGKSVMCSKTALTVLDMCSKADVLVDGYDLPLTGERNR